MSSMALLALWRAVSRFLSGSLAGRSGMESAVGERAAEAFAKEQKEQRDVNASGRQTGSRGSGVYHPPAGRTH